MTILDDIRAAIEQTKPIVYYAAHDGIPQGKAIRIAAHNLYPDVWFFHPSDFAAQQAELRRHCRLVDFRAWKPSQDDIERAAKEWFGEQLR